MINPCTKCLVGPCCTRPCQDLADFMNYITPDSVQQLGSAIKLYDLNNKQINLIKDYDNILRKILKNSWVHPSEHEKIEIKFEIHSVEMKIYLTFRRRQLRYHQIGCHF